MLVQNFLSGNVLMYTVALGKEPRGAADIIKISNKQ